MTPQHPCCSTGLLRKVLYECAFSSAGLARDKCDFARTRACILQMACQLFELGMAFQEVHGFGQYPACRPRRTWAALTWGCLCGNLGSSPDLCVPVPAYRAFQPIHAGLRNATLHG